MNSIAKVFSNFREFYSEINGATLTGAIDVVVVEQPDGSYSCSPFHVRFGKLGVLRSREKVVDIEINGEPVNIHMKLGESGEAFFVEECPEDDLEILPEHMATSPIPTSSFNLKFEESLQNTNDEVPIMVLPRRNSIDFSNEQSEIEKIKYENQKSDYSLRRHTDNTTGRPDLSITKKEYTTQKIRQEWAEQDQIFQMDGVEETGDWKNSTTMSDEYEKQFRPIVAEVDETGSKQESDKVDVLADKLSIIDDKVAKEESKSKKKRRKKSIMKKKNSQRKNSTSSSAGSVHSDQNEAETDSMTVSNITVSSNSGSPKSDEIINVEIKETLIEPKESMMEPTRLHELDIHFFSDTEIASGMSPRQSRPSTPIQSDTEFEISQREKNDDNIAASWKWGELPTKIEDKEDPNTTQAKQAQRNSMLSSFMSFMKYNKKMRKNQPEGLYLADLDAEGMDPEVAALYFPQTPKEVMNQGNNEDDRESGNGTSLPQSPTSMEGIKSLDSDYDDNKIADKYSVEFIAISLCGGLETGGPTEEEFEKHRLQYADVCDSPSIFSSPNLVVRINEKYYSWATACPQVMTLMAFQKPLPQDFCDKPSSSRAINENQSVTQQQVSNRRGLSWWYWRRSTDSNQIKPDIRSESIDEAKIVAQNAVATQTSRSNSPEETIIISNADKLKEEGYNGSMSSEDSDIAADKINQSIESSLQISLNEKFRKSLRLSSDQIECLNLNTGMNEIVFSVTTAYQGTTRCKCYLFKWKHNDKVVISDIDGTITKSDVLGHILPMVGKNWEQIGVAQLFSKIEENGYKMLYLSARAIGQAQTTRDYLQSIRQGDVKLPDGPLLLNPTSLMSALHREVIEKKPELFKIACLSDIQALFPEKNPFYAGYGNRINDVWAYRAVGIPIMRIFTINTKGELKHELTQTFQSTYCNMAYIVDQLFPPINNIEEEDIEFTSFNYWREPVLEIDLNDDIPLSVTGLTLPIAPLSTTPLTPVTGKVTPTSMLIQQQLPTIPEN